MGDDVKARTGAVEDDGQAGLSALLADEASLSEGQRQRIALFRRVEGGVCTRVEQLCVTNGIEVTDVAVLVVDVSAHDLFFHGEDAPDGTRVVLGHREEVRGFLRSVLPPAEDAPFDPYEDLAAPAPARCVRVMIVDHESLTVMNYGTFLTVRLDEAEMPDA